MSIDKKYILAGAIASSIMLHTGMTTAFAATEYKVITADAVNFRSGPSTSYSSLGSFNKGDKVWETHQLGMNWGYDGSYDYLWLEASSYSDWVSNTTYDTERYMLK